MIELNICLKPILSLLILRKVYDKVTNIADLCVILAIIYGNDEKVRECDFISEDPIKDNLNWYAYCGNNPIGMVDPTGLGQQDGKEEPASKGDGSPQGGLGKHKKKNKINDGFNFDFTLHINVDNKKEVNSDNSNGISQGGGISTKHSGGGYDLNNWDKWSPDTADPDPVKPEKREDHSHKEKFPSVGAQIKSLTNDNIDERYPPGFTEEQKRILDNFYNSRWGDNTNVYDRKYEPWDSGISDPMSDNLMILRIDIAGIAIGKVLGKLASGIVGKIVSKYGDDVVKGLGKTGESVLPKVIHGNSLNSPKQTWFYKLYKQDGTFLKNGITSKPIPENRYTRSFMSDKYMEKVLFPNRKAAYEYEFSQNILERGPLNLNMH